MIIGLVVFLKVVHLRVVALDVAYGQNESVILQKVDMHVQITQKQTKSYYTEAEKNVAITLVSLLLANTNKPLIQNMPSNSWDTHPP